MIAPAALELMAFWATTIAPRQASTLVRACVLVVRACRHAQQLLPCTVLPVSYALSASRSTVFLDRNSKQRVCSDLRLLRRADQGIGRHSAADSLAASETHQVGCWMHDSRPPAQLHDLLKQRSMISLCMQQVPTHEVGSSCYSCAVVASRWLFVLLSQTDVTCPDRGDLRC